MIRHIVALRFRKNVSQEVKNGLYADLDALKMHLPGIEDFRTFSNVSPELPLVRDFNDVFWFDFRDSSARDAYLDDTQHKLVGARIVAELEGGIDGVFVMDVQL